AIAVTPTISVQMNATTCRNLRAIMTHTSLERLADAEVNAPRARLRFAVHLQVRDPIELIAEIDARRTDRREISETGACGVDESRRHVERPVRHVAEIEEGDASELADQRLADFGRSFQHRQPSDRQAKAAEGADLEASPAANARCTAQEVALEERNTGGPAKRVDGAEMHAVRPDERATHTHVLARFATHLPV